MLCLLTKLLNKVVDAITPLIVLITDQSKHCKETRHLQETAINYLGSPLQEGRKHSKDKKIIPNLIQTYNEKI